MTLVRLSARTPCARGTPPSWRGGTIAPVNSAHLEEVEKTLLLISHARERAERSARAIRRDDAGSRLAVALEEADRRLLALHGELMRSSYFGDTQDQLKLAG